MKKLFLILPVTAASLMFSACDDKEKAETGNGKPEKTEATPAPDAPRNSTQQMKTKLIASAI
ncbi:hypothetical protein OAF66_03095, partial [bacterium]|nr:hypothetical protein [bacterium]